MTRTQHSLRHAGSAIAAALAIASTPSLAQDAAAPFPEAPAPVIVVPDIPVPATPEPTVVLPTVQPETVQPVPEASVAPAAPQAVPSTAATSRTRVTAPAARAAPEPVTAAVAPEPAAVEQPAALPPIDPAQPVAAEPVAPVAMTEPSRPGVEDNAGILALVLGALAFLALAIWGFVAIGRRKPVRRYVAENTAPAPVRAEPAPLAQREPMTVVPRDDRRPSEPSFAQRQAPVAGMLSHTGAAVALPARTPESYAERDALMKRMIAARPDRANPFTDRGARTRRARLILQSLGRDFGETEPWIDLSQYPNNWPELARKRSAAA